MFTRTFAAVITLLLPLSVPCQTKYEAPDVLASKSDIVVVGRVGNRMSEWNGDKSRIQTRVTIAVTETIKGSGVPSTIEVVVPGGEVDGVGEWYSHVSRFANDEDLVLFAQKNAGGTYRVTGGEGGKLSIIKDPATGQKIVPSIGSLEVFTAKLRSSIRLGQNQDIRK